MERILLIESFKDYRNLPFSEQIQDELFKRHTHAELLDPEQIVYTEKDVLILLQLLKIEQKKSLKRYEPQSSFNDSVVMDESPDGEYVKFNDL